MFFWQLLFYAACTDSGNRGKDHSDNYPAGPGQLKIAYNVLYDLSGDDYEIFVMNLDGSGQKNITDRVGPDRLYYAYQDKIYFASDRDTIHGVYFLYEMDASGENIRKITDFPIDDSWISSRRRGEELIVKPELKVDTAFYIINVQNRQQQVIRPDLAYFYDPFFSPDGKQIVFRGARKMPAGNQRLADELYIINDDGSQLKQLTHYPDDDSTATWFDYRVGPPVWYLEDKISFSSLRDGSYSIFTVNIDGTDLQRLTTAENNQVYHSWSHDGSMMVFEQSSGDYENYDIYLLNAKDGAVTRVTADSILQQAPVFVYAHPN